MVILVAACRACTNSCLLLKIFFNYDYNDVFAFNKMSFFVLTLCNPKRLFLLTIR